MSEKRRWWQSRHRGDCQAVFLFGEDTTRCNCASPEPDARRFYIHPGSREWAEGYVTGKGWPNVTLVGDHHCDQRRLYDSPPCDPVEPIEHLKPISDLLRGNPVRPDEGVGT